MSGGEIEAIGGAMTGGLVAAALDPGAGIDLGGHELRACQNCNTSLIGPYCHRCGQSGHVHRTLTHVLEEVAHGVLHVDSKGWQTLPLLVFNPGRLTREYIHGRRRRYIAPFALYLFMVFVTFLVIGLTGTTDFDVRNLQKAEIKTAEAELAKARNDLNAVKAARGSPPEAHAMAEAAVNRAASELTRAKAAAVSLGSTSSESLGEIIERQARTNKIKVDVGDAVLNAKAVKALKNVDLVLYKIQQKAYKLSFLLVPMSLPVMWLLFAWKRGVTLYDHAVFILYSLSFMLLLGCVILIMGLADVSGGPLVALALGAPIVHVFAQVRGTYQLSLFSALWRTVVLLVACAIILSAYLTLMVAIGVLD